jgi:hypothetical protein
MAKKSLKGATHMVITISKRYGPHLEYHMNGPEAKADYESTRNSHSFSIGEISDVILLKIEGHEIK